MLHQCTGRAVACLSDPRHDVLFVGYQAEGTMAHTIQREAPNRAACG